MKWNEAKTVSELQNIDTFCKVKKEIEKDIGKEAMTSFKKNSWKNLFHSIQIYKNSMKSTLSELEEGYFISKSSELIFYLVELQGEERLKKLDVNLIHYKDKKRAKKWMNDIAKEIHPDKCNHKKASNAMAMLTRMYKSMVNDG